MRVGNEGRKFFTEVHGGPVDIIRGGEFSECFWHGEVGGR